MKFKLSLVLLCTSLSLCLTAQDLPDFDKQTPPPAPDYSRSKNWAALPYVLDAADGTPKGIEAISDSNKQVDVFYIHPTVYSKGTTWNADVNDAAVNKLVDDKPLKYQASAWNGSCRVYAPRYRQAILASFFTEKPDGGKALDLAYSDVKRAFEYYLAHYNNGRPIVIASHSQGSRHARMLIKEFFDTNDKLKGKLVCAYIVGFPVFEKNYTSLKPCNTAEQTGCILSWATFREGFEPIGINTFYKDAICVNPVIWKTDTTKSNFDNHKGMVLLNFNKLMKHRVSAQVHKNILWAKVKYPLARKMDNLHIADINLFWEDIREDVKRRIGYYWK